MSLSHSDRLATRRLIRFVQSEGPEKGHDGLQQFLGIDFVSSLHDYSCKIQLNALYPMRFFHFFFLYVFGASCLSTIAQQASPDPEDHFAGVDARGDQGMGFSHEKTTHHFHLLADGGAIEIESNGPTDAVSQEAIRQHLTMIAAKFSQGDFAIPMFIHATVPPGVETMKQLKSKITYEAENTERGAQLRITTHDAEALTAIHSFLRFQIQDHQTGDSLEVQK
jgi:hypothetical protein